jgi:ELMO domain-containing protein
MKSIFWTEYGFQSDNPRTDFRAAGLFGLRQLIYFAEYHNHELKEIASKTKH